MNKRAGLSVVALCMAFGILASAPAVVAAYAPYTAASYADAHWNTCGTSNYPCISNGNEDCTNYVSQALHEGGYDYVNVGGSKTDYHNWWLKKDWIGYSYSNSWSVSGMLKQFLLVDYPGGWPKPTRYTDEMTVESGAGVGDVLFYDWTGDGSIDHAAIQVGRGNTSDGYYGDYIDAHSPSRYHKYWAERTDNPDWQSTVIYPMHIDPAN